MSHREEFSLLVRDEERPSVFSPSITEIRGKEDQPWQQLVSDSWNVIIRNESKILVMKKQVLPIKAEVDHGHDL